MAEESFITSSVYGRTFFPGKAAPAKAGFRVPIWVSNFSAPFEETAETCLLGSPSTVRLRSTTQNSGDGFKAGVWQSGESSQEAFASDLVLNSCCDCPA